MPCKSPHPERHPLNQGDFYSEYRSCTACGAPQHEAPDLMEHDKEDNICYFRRQPVTVAEIEQAISAMMVSCVEAIRYGGTDEAILKRLYENGMSELCDHRPQTIYPVVVRNRVNFSFTGTLDQLVDALTNYLTRVNSYITINDLKIESAVRFRFVERVDKNIAGSVYEGIQVRGGEMSVWVRQERGIPDAVAGRSSLLYDYLKQDSRASRMEWRSEDPSNDTVYEKPF